MEDHRARATPTWRDRLGGEEWWPIAATVAIFTFYALLARLLTGTLAGIRGDLTTDHAFTRVPALHPAHPLGSVDLQFSLYWFTGALFAGLVSLILAGWSIAVLWREAAVGRRRLVLTAFVLLSVLGVALSLGSPGGLIAFPRALTCATPALIPVRQGFLCHDVLQPGWRTLVFGGGGGWVRGMLRDKLLLNAIFQIAASAIILAALVVARCGRQDGQDVATQARHNAILLKLFAMGAAVLCLRVVTEILFANWPIAVIQQGGDARASDTLTALLGAYILLYGVLAALVMAMGMVAARLLGGRLPSFEGDPTVGRWFGWIGGWVMKDSTVKTLLALSPIFTATAGALTGLRGDR